MATTQLDSDMLAFIGENFVEKMLAQQQRHKDRAIAQDDGWMRYDNFGDFYAEHKHKFIVSFSKPEMLVSAVVKMFLSLQMQDMVDRAPSPMPDGQRSMSELMERLVAESYPAVEKIMREKWPKEYADILERNSKKLFF